jgi:hypothetical protein
MCVSHHTPHTVEQFCKRAIVVERARCSSVASEPKPQYIDGERLYCHGGKYEGSIVTFVKQLRVKVRVRFEDEEARDLMPTSVEVYIPPVQKRVKTSTLIVMVKVGLAMQGLDMLDREGRNRSQGIRMKEWSCESAKGKTFDRRKTLTVKRKR